MKLVTGLGRRVVATWRGVSHQAALNASIVVRACRPSTWRPTVRDVLARQVLFTGFEALPFVVLVACLVGLSIVVQAQVWARRVGQSELLGPILVAVVIREVGPFLANFVVIGRSGTAIAAELATMRVRGEIRLLDAQGVDPFLYLVLPRVVGTMVSVFCLAVVFVVVSLTAGFVTSLLVGAYTGPPAVFFDSVYRAIQPVDTLNVVAKTLLPGMLTGSICCTEGLSVRGAVTEVPQATTRGLVRSLAGLFIISAIVSTLTYV